jgi:hypothetical protein
MSRTPIAALWVSLIPSVSLATVCRHPDPNAPPAIAEADCPQGGSTTLALPIPDGSGAGTVTLAQLLATYDRDVTYIERLPRFLAAALLFLLSLLSQRVDASMLGELRGKSQSVQKWQVADVVRTGRTVRGSVLMAGADYLPHGGRFEVDLVNGQGTLYTKDGQSVATLQLSVDRTLGLTGTLSAIDGRTYTVTYRPQDAAGFAADVQRLQQEVPNQQ